MIWSLLIAHAFAGVTLESFDSKTSLADMGWKGKYHQLVTEDGNTFVRSKYVVGTEAKYLSKEVEWDLKQNPILSWRWRVRKFPKDALILDSDKSDAGAQIYLVWRDFPRYYVIKYFWATSEPVGTELRQGNVITGRLFGEILESGGPTSVWKTEKRNVADDFLRAFKHEAPGNVGGIALLSDGDETKSESEADYDDFVVSPVRDLQ